MSLKNSENSPQIADLPGATRVKEGLYKGSDWALDLPEEWTRLSASEQINFLSDWFDKSPKDGLAGETLRSAMKSVNINDIDLTSPAGQANKIWADHILSK